MKIQAGSVKDDPRAGDPLRRGGFPVTQLIGYRGASASATPRRKFPGAFLATYAPDGKGHPGRGRIFKNPALAHTLALDRRQGRDVHLPGEIAEKIDAFMRANGGFLRKEDLAQHTATWVDPVSVNYRGYDVYELPPNCQGIAALQMLNILEGYDLRSMGYNSPGALHVMIEAKKALADRAKFYADPAFSQNPAGGPALKRTTRRSAASSSVSRGRRAGTTPAVPR